ncbi:MAG: fimbrillin family protein [Bacteroides sp.]|nr:fimbrillin family protein [Bacteroides sp.]
MKRNLLPLSFIALALLALPTACTDDATPGNDQPGDSVALRLGSLLLEEQAEIAPLGRAADGASSRTADGASSTDCEPAHSRAAAGTRATSAEGGTKASAGVFLKGQAGTSYSTINNSQATKGTDASTPWIASNVKLTEENADIAVYYPYNGNYAGQSDGTLLLKAGVRNATTNSYLTQDLWCAKYGAAVNRNTKIEEMTLQQVYSRLTLKLSKDATYVSDAEITGVAMKNNTSADDGKVLGEAHYDLFGTAGYTNAAADGATGFDLTLPSKQTISTTNTTVTIDLLIIPITQVMTDNILLTFTINGRKMYKNITPMNLAELSKDNATFARGKWYTISLKLKPSALEVTAVSVADWEKVTMPDNSFEVTI